MKSLIYLLMTAVLALSFDAFAQSATDLYQVNMTVSRDGTVLSKPNILVKSGKQAEVNFSDTKDPEAGFRILLTVQPSAAQRSSKSTVSFDTMFFEKVQGEWVLRGQPQLRIALGEPASFELTNENIKRVAPEFKVDVTVSKGSIDHKVSASSPAIPSLTERLLSGGGGVCGSAALGIGLIASANQASAEVESCCSAHCPGGGTLTCCGAEYCCDGICGTCCAPP